MGRLTQVWGMSLEATTPAPSLPPGLRGRQGPHGILFDKGPLTSSPQKPSWQEGRQHSLGEGNSASLSVTLARLWFLQTYGPLSHPRCCSHRQNVGPGGSLGLWVQREEF